ncbi:glycosyltransferase [Akkermansiaceae bacterium]|nr:glycosyltransferase [Akkermansiaceae bacterium]
MISKKAFSNIFYHQHTKNQFIKSGVDKKKCFVANNTILVDQKLCRTNKKRDKILFIGSLDNRKRVDLLIEAFIEIHKSIPLVTLDIIGSGVQLEYLKTISNFNENIKFHGRIENKEALSEFYNHAICEVSPMQAGLSVLQSQGFGVPFITHKDSITGGEIYNIIDGYNGFLFDSHKNNLSDILLNLCNKEKLIIEMGNNARTYYNEFCTNANMVNGFIDSIYLSETTRIDLENY